MCVCVCAVLEVKKRSAGTHLTQPPLFNYLFIYVK